MGIFDFITRLFSANKFELSREELLDNSVCPQCWGYQSYDDKMREVSKDFQKNLSNGSVRNAFVKDFIDTHVTGIVLKSEGNKQICPSCKSGYKRVNTKAN